MRLPPRPPRRGRGPTHQRRPRSMARLALPLLLLGAVASAGPIAQTVLVVLGDRDQHIMELRMREANEYLDSHPEVAHLVLSGNAKTPAAGAALGEMAGKMARMLHRGPRLRGAVRASPCVLQERVSNNTAQHLACTAEVLAALGLQRQPLVVVTNAYAAPRLEHMLALLGRRSAAWRRREVSVSAAPDPAAAQLGWRLREEAERHLARAERDVDEALRGSPGACRPELSTCAVFVD